MTISFPTALKPVLIVCLAVCFGCIQVVKTDMDTYLQNKKQFKRKHVIFSTTMEDLVKRYDLYQGRDIELTAPVKFFGKDDFKTLYIELEEEGSTIRAYEDNYRDYVDIYARNLLLWVTSEEDQLTVRGKLKKNGLELDQLAYKDYSLDTNLKPRRYRKYDATRASSLPNRQGYRYGGQ